MKNKKIFYTTCSILLLLGIVLNILIYFWNQLYPYISQPIFQFSTLSIIIFIGIMGSVLLIGNFYNKKNKEKIKLTSRIFIIVAVLLLYAITWIGGYITESTKLKNLPHSHITMHCFPIMPGILFIETNIYDSSTSWETQELVIHYIFGTKTLMIIERSISCL